MESERTSTAGCNRTPSVDTNIGINEMESSSMGKEFHRTRNA
jgi:hypothetical protein